MNTDNRAHYPSATGATTAQSTAKVLALQAENKRLRELWQRFIAADSRGESQRAADIVEEAAAMLTELKEATDE